MSLTTLLDDVFTDVSDLVAHQGTITLSDSSGVAGAALELSAELAITGTTATVTGASGALLSDGQRAPSGLSLAIGGDTYALTATATVQDGSLSIAITPAAATTYAAATSVVLADSVSWDLVALDAQVEASRERRQPGSARAGTDHSATVYVLKSKLAGVTADTLREMELTIDGLPAPVKDVVDESPHWALIAGGAPR